MFPHGLRTLVHASLTPNASAYHTSGEKPQSNYERFSDRGQEAGMSDSWLLVFGL